MPASASYLTKYLSASNTNPKSSTQSPDFEDSNRPKKRRKKDKTTNTDTLLIADDDEGLLLSASGKVHGNEDEDDNPLIYNAAVRSAEFRKKKTSSWQIVQGEGDGPARLQDTAHDGEIQPQDDASKILAAAARETAQRRADIDDEDRPAIVPSDEIPRMSNGARAGLQTASDTAALLAAQQAQAEADSSTKAKKKSRTSAAPEPEQETIYRDASGRRIDVSQRRAAARAEQVAKEAAEKQARDAAMGEVQLRARADAKRELDEAKFLTLGRTADDEDLNRQLRAEVRWDDPMAAYMAERAAERQPARSGRDASNDGGGGGGGAKRRVYLGAAPPNRYGIKPGWRWDGVDRGTGFEREWFQARGRKTRNENLEYQWAYDE